GPRRIDLELEALTAAPHSRAQMVLFVRPFADDPTPARLVDLASRCRRQGISIGAIVPPLESVPGVWPALPTRVTRLAKASAAGTAPHGRISILARNLDQIDEPGAELRLEIAAHGGTKPFRTDLLKRPEAFSNLVAAASSPTPTDRVELVLS